MKRDFLFAFDARANEGTTVNLQPPWFYRPHWPSLEEVRCKILTIPIESTATYANDGNTTASNGVAYVYDFETHVIQAGAGITMVYDSDGKRVRRPSRA